VKSGLKAGTRAGIWTVREVLSWAVEDFRRRGLDNPRLEAEVLLAGVLESDRLKLYTHFDTPLNLDERDRFRDFVTRRRSGEPSAYITDKKEFWSRNFFVNTSVLIPRPETETLVEHVLEECDRNTGYRFIDIGTGCGVIAVTLACEFNGSLVDGVDISPAAVETARLNAEAFDVAGSCSFFESDLFGSVSEDASYDVIVSNPPYIPSAQIMTLDSCIKDFEPTGALDGGPDGLAIIEKIIRRSAAYLRDGGLVALEIGHDQAPAVKSIFEKAGCYERIAGTNDLSGICRVMSARRKGR